MQEASQILAAPLPSLRHAMGNLHSSVSSDFLHESLMQPWTTFEQDIRSALEALDLNFQIPHNDFAGDEVYLVGNGNGLSGRFVNNVCIPVAQILTRSAQQSFIVGDSQSFITTPPIVPDVSMGVTIVSDYTTEVKIVGEFKTWWTVAMNPISDHLSRVLLGPHLGQLAAQMRRFHLRFGFLSTYAGTMFVKRTADLTFAISRPINAPDINLSVRECLAGLSILAEQCHKYTESPGFRVQQLRGPAQIHLQESHRPRASTFPAQGTVEGDVIIGLTANITQRSIVISDQRGTLNVINVSRRLSPPNQAGKAIFEITHRGMRYIAKCWGPESEEASNAEIAVYERLKASRPAGFDVFASMVLCGDAICSSLFSAGRCIVLTHKSGEVLSHIWDGLGDRERLHVREECEKAIHILRSLSIYVPDTGKHNVLYDRDTGAITLLDFETGMHCSPSENVPFAELASLFGDALLRGRGSGG